MGSENPTGVDFANIRHQLAYGVMLDKALDDEPVADSIIRDATTMEYGLDPSVSAEMIGMVALDRADLQLVLNDTADSQA